jgi:hypothetical protein
MLSQHSATPHFQNEARNIKPAAKTWTDNTEQGATDPSRITLVHGPPSMRLPGAQTSSGEPTPSRSIHPADNTGKKGPSSAQLVRPHTT